MVLVWGSRGEGGGAGKDGGQTGEEIYKSVSLRPQGRDYLNDYGGLQTVQQIIWPQNRFCLQGREQTKHPPSPFQGKLIP